MNKKEKGFRKYIHVEKLGHKEVEDIEFGTTYVFPKLDGTNASVWLDSQGVLRTGSRNRVLSDSRDNFDFNAHIHSKEKFKKFFEKWPSLTLFGEYLVPHAIKHYREDAWKKFYVFDVYSVFDSKFLPYEKYVEILEEFGIYYIEPMTKVIDGSLETYLKFVEQNDYLMQTGQIGEGIVIKNYDWKNQFGDQIWAKIVRTEFKEENKRAFGLREIDGKLYLEKKIAETFVTPTLVQKELAKLQDIERRELIPRFLETVWYTLIKEESWNILKKFNNPTIDYKTLRKHVTALTKKYAPEVF